MFILSKDVSPADEAASLCPCLCHLDKVLTRSLTDGVENFLVKSALLLVSKSCNNFIITYNLQIQRYGAVDGGWVIGARPNKAR